jgi:hypothetical protein
MKLWMSGSRRLPASVIEHSDAAGRAGLFSAAQTRTFRAGASFIGRAAFDKSHTHMDYFLVYSRHDASRGGPRARHGSRLKARTDPNNAVTSPGVMTRASRSASSSNRGGRSATPDHRRVSHHYLLSPFQNDASRSRCSGRMAGGRRTGPRLRLITNIFLLTIHTPKRMSRSRFASPGHPHRGTLSCSAWASDTRPEEFEGHGRRDEDARSRDSSRSSRWHGGWGREDVVTHTGRQFLAERAPPSRLKPATAPASAVLDRGQWRRPPSIALRATATPVLINPHACLPTLQRQMGDLSQGARRGRQAFPAEAGRSSGVLRRRRRATRALRDAAPYLTAKVQGPYADWGLDIAIALRVRKLCRYPTNELVRDRFIVRHARGSAAPRSVR